MQKSKIKKLKIPNYTNIKKITLRLPKNIAYSIETLSEMKNFSFNETTIKLLTFALENSKNLKTYKEKTIKTHNI